MNAQQKYRLALALQQLQRNPDEIVCNLQYHLCLVTRHREQIFVDTEPYIEPIVQCFESLAVEAAGIIKARLLWLAADHMHIYLEATPDYAVDRLAGMLRKHLEKTVCNSSSVPLKRKTPVWEELYYAGSLG
jgi:REP element-mobilizing transposase RayT